MQAGFTRSTLILVTCSLFFGFSPVAWGSVSAALQPVPQPPLTAIALGDGVYGIKAPGTGMNTGFVVGDEGVFVFACSAPDYDGRMDAIRSVTNKPIIYVGNGHAAGDDSGCNAFFKGFGAVIIGSTQARDDYLRTRQDFGVPELTFDDSLILHMGAGRTVHLIYMGMGHTIGDAVAYIPEQKVLFSADLLFVDIHPTVNAGDSVNWQRILRRLQAWDIDWIVSGHGELLRGNGYLETQWQYFETMRERVRALMSSGKSLEEIQSEIDLGEYAGYRVIRPASEVVETLYRELRAAGG